MMNKMLLFILLSTIILSEDLREKAWVRLEVINKEVIIGEPVYIKVVKYGTPPGGDVYLDGRVCKEPYVKVTGVGDVLFEPDGSKIVKKIELIEKVRERVFNLWNICYLPMKEAEAREYEVCYRDEGVGACDKFRFKYPEGEDLEVYKRMKKEARDFTFPESGIKKEEILEKFPTSTYAGWVVWPAIFCPSEWEIDKFYKFLLSKHGNSVPTKDGWRSLSGDDYLNWQKGWAEKILENHPDFAMANNLKLLLAVINLWQGNKERGEEWLEELQKDSKEYRWGKMFFEYVKERKKEKGKE